MEIRRVVVTDGIDFAICDKFTPENRRLIIPDLYDSLMQVVVNALNSDSGEELPDKVYAEFKLMNDSRKVWDMLGEFTIELASDVRTHFIRERHDGQFKYKFVKSGIDGPLARDNILVDLPLTMHWGKVNENNTEDMDILEVTDDNPCLDTVNEFYEAQDRELKSFRKYKSRL